MEYPEAVLFDCDGVLVDTERDGHRVAFNEAFKRKGPMIDRQFQKSAISDDRSGSRVGCATLRSAPRDRRRERKDDTLLHRYLFFFTSHT